MKKDDTTNLTPCVWNAPNKEYHLKSVRYNCYDYSQGKPKERAYLCNLCGGTVVYTTSKTGTRYLCDARKTGHSYTNRYGRRTGGSFTLRRYYPNLWHSKSCVPHEGEGIHPSVVAYTERMNEYRRAAGVPTVDLVPVRPDDDWEAHAHDLAFGDWMDATRGL